ncbi:MAG: hypothetical protein R3B54_03270 [Bdellovibrionota bacterium]
MVGHFQQSGLSHLRKPPFAHGTNVARKQHGTVSKAKPHEQGAIVVRVPFRKPYPPANSRGKNKDRRRDPGEYGNPVVLRRGQGFLKLGAAWR